jgi:hypothetical protein
MGFPAFQRGASENQPFYGTKSIDAATVAAPKRSLRRSASSEVSLFAICSQEAPRGFRGGGTQLCLAAAPVDALVLCGG